jgi:Flp pilus assembly protein TadG
MPRPARRRARGLAAIEFSSVLVGLLTVLYGIATFGAVAHTQQVVSRAAEDGARAVQRLPGARTTDDARISALVHDSMAVSLIVPPAVGASLAARRTWIAAHVVVNTTGPVPDVAGLVAWTVTVSYPYGDNRLLPSLPLVDASRWMPTQLRARATVAFRS